MRSVQGTTDWLQAGVVVYWVQDDRVCSATVERRAPQIVYFVEPFRNMRWARANSVHQFAAKTPREACDKRLAEVERLLRHARGKVEQYEDEEKALRALLAELPTRSSGSARRGRRAVVCPCEVCSRAGRPGS